MMSSMLLIAFATLAWMAPVAVQAQSHQWPVEHAHGWRSCRGTLLVTPAGIEYQTDHKKHARSWPYAEIQQLKIISPTKLEITTYEDSRLLLGRDRDFSFKLLEGELTMEISAQLAAKTGRPLVTSIPPTTEGAPRFELPVKHLHNLGGCAGVVNIYADRVTFQSADEPEHTRFWRYADIETFSHSERFRLELTVSEAGFGGSKGYNFQLKGNLPPEAYDYLWARVYPSKFRRHEATTPLDSEAHQITSRARFPFSLETQGVFSTSVESPVW
jgi:hypothetical protein